MVSAQEIRTEESQIRLPVMVLETGQLHPNSQIPAAESLRNLSPYEVNLSGTCVGSAGTRRRALSVSEQSALGKVIASPPRSSVRRRLPFCPSIGTGGLTPGFRFTWYLGYFPGFRVTGEEE